MAGKKSTDSPAKVPAGPEVSRTVAAQKAAALRADGKRRVSNPAGNRKFRLLRGRHFDAKTGDTVEKGGVVESPDALDVLEPDRYRAVGDTAAVSAGGRGVAATAPPDADSAHADEDVNAAPRSRTLDEEDDDDDEGPAEADDEADDEAPEGEGAEVGEDDITKDFPAAAGCDVVVKKVKGGFAVFDTDDLSNHVNPKPLKTKADVNKFLKTYGD